MKSIFNYIFTIVLFFTIGIKSQAQGWVMSESDNRVTIIGDEWIKSISNGEEGELTFMFNGGRDIIILIDDVSETYAKGLGNDYCNAMKSMMEEMKSQMPPEQLKMMKDMINQQKAKPAPKVTVTKGRGEVIAGYQTEKYSINVDGELFEEKWITNDPALKSILEVYKSIQELTSKTVTCAVMDESFLKTSPEFSSEYKNVERTGIELKSISYEYGSPETQTEVISLEKEDISSYEFEIPDDYGKTSFKELIMSMSEN
ncbi:MAG: DUF4412 domain-containing protein [Cyclobacteriaceae bacterium]|nr:DUF4412 domain-containing protein [Cyclobacteriaceae bacterium]